MRDIRFDFDIVNVSPYTIQLLGLKVDKGVVVTNVIPTGPAEKAGLHRGDVIVAIDKKPIADSRDLLDQFLLRTVGEKIGMSVQRGDKKIELMYPVEEGAAR